MKKSLRSFINVNRTPLLLLGIVLGITVFGAIAWSVGAQDGAKKSPWTTEEAAARAAITADRLASSEQDRSVKSTEFQSEAILGSPEFFSGALTVADPTFDNPGGSGTGSGIHYYDVFQFTVGATGPHTIEVSSFNTSGAMSNALDTFTRVYANSFNPAVPTGALTFNDDFTGTLTVLPGPFTTAGLTATATGFTGTQPSSRNLNVNLTAGTQYFLVLTSFRETNFVVPATGSVAGPTGPYWVGINPGVNPAGTPTPTSTPTATPTGTPAGTPTPTSTPTATPTPPPPGACTAANTIIYGYNLDNDNLVRFTAATPGTYGSSVALTGFNANEFIVGMDFRPATPGFIYAVTGVFGAGTPLNRVVAVNTSGGAVVPIGTGVPQTADSFYGVDFNPVPDRIRIVGNADTSRRLNPNNGTLAGTDTPLAYVAGDPGFGVNPNVVHVAYTNSQAGATLTTLYGIDSGRDTLVRIGGPDGTPSPNTGELTTIGPLGVDSASFGGFDIQPFTNIAYAALSTGPVGARIQQLFSINLATGAATLVGNIGNGTNIIDGFTIAPCSTAAGVLVSGRVLTPDGRGLRNAVVSMTDGSGVTRIVTTSTFGYYQFEDVSVGETFVMSVASRRYRFGPRAVQVLDSLSDVDFIGQE